MVMVMFSKLLGSYLGQRKFRVIVRARLVGL